jgi:hypothetical protein
MGCIFTVGWHVVLDLVKIGRDIVGHGKVHILFLIVSCYNKATINFASPVSGSGVKVLKGLDEAVGVVFADAFYAKVVIDEAEEDAVVFVTLEGRCLKCWEHDRTWQGRC